MTLHTNIDLTGRRKSMESKMFIIGLSLGMIGGAMLVANSQMVRKLIKNGQNELQRKMNELKNCECKCDCECNDNAE